MLPVPHRIVGAVGVERGEPEAVQLLDLLVALPGMNGGGHIEQHVPGIGWVNADDAETAVICHNRQVADREQVEYTA